MPSATDRHQVAAYLTKLELGNDPEFWRKMPNRSEDTDSSKWIAAEDLRIQMRRTSRVPINLEALARLPVSGKNRMELVMFATSPAATSDAGGDFHVSYPESHREFQFNRVTTYAAAYWIDPPVDEIKGIDIRAII